MSDKSSGVLLPEGNVKPPVHGVDAGTMAAELFTESGGVNRTYLEARCDAVPGRYREEFIDNLVELITTWQEQKMDRQDIGARVEAELAVIGDP